jgi:Tfp pilus assembly PilM family ATPase
MSAFSLSLRATTAPLAALEIASHRVSAASLTSRRGAPVVAAHGSEPLAEGVLAPSLTAANVKDRRALLGVIGRVLDKVGRPRRIGLVVPDPIAKVSLLKFQQVPSRAQDLDQLIRWQLRKAAPFPIEEGQVSYVAGAAGPEGQEFLVSIARRDTVREYEDLVAEAGAQAVVVDLATLNVVNAVLGAPQRPTGDWLLVHAGLDWASMVILRGADPVLFRSRGADAEGSLADLVHQTAMYYEDRLNGKGLQRVLLSGAPGMPNRQTGDAGPLARALEERLGAAIEQVDPRASVNLDARLTLSPHMIESLTPVVGLLIRDQGVGASIRQGYGGQA